MAPELIKLGNFSLSSYSFFIFLGTALVFVSGLLLSVKAGIQAIEAAAFLFFGLAVSVIGAKTYLCAVLVIQNIPVTGNPFLGILTIPQGEGGFVGALGAGSLFAFLYSRQYRLPFWELGDHVAPGLAAGYAVMKIGCFLNGCCGGTDSSLPWAVTFPFQDQSVHPVQLYESGMALILSAFLYRRHSNPQSGPGETIGLFLILFAIIRIATGFFRAGPESQHIVDSAAFLLTAGAGLIVLKHPKISDSCPASEWHSKQIR